MLPQSADVVVIGGGVFGTSAAFHLAEAGVQNVVLLDRGPIASGTTPFAAGQMGYLNRDRRILPFAIYCLEFFEQFQKRTGYAIDFRQTGSIRIALTEQYHEDLEARLAAAKAGGQEAEFLDAATLRKRVPLLEPPDDARILSIPRDGFVEPKSVAVGLAAAARDLGVKIHTRTEVQEIEVAKGAVRGVRTDAGYIESPWVVVAAGAWSRSLTRKLGLGLRSVPVRHQAFVTAPMADVLPNQPIVRITEPQVYCRPEAGGLLVGGYGYRPLSFEMDEFPPGFEIPALPADPIYYQQLTEAATRFFPCLEKAVVIQERRGLPTISPDGKLVVGEPDGLKGLVVASACGVGGIERAPGVGRLISEIISGQPTFLPLDMLDVNRFGDEFARDAALRARCEELYAHHYHEAY